MRASSTEDGVCSQKEYGDVESARRSVVKGESWGFLYFPQNYTRSLLERIEYGQDTPDHVVDDSVIDVSLDMSSGFSSTTTPAF